MKKQAQYSLAHAVILLSESDSMAKVSQGINLFILVFSLIIYPIPDMVVKKRMKREVRQNCLV